MVLTEHTSEQERERVTRVLKYRIADGHLYLDGRARVEPKLLAQMTVLLARVQGETVDDSVQRLLALKAREHDGPEVSAFERQIRAAVDDLLASGWAPADEGVLFSEQA